MRVLIVVGGAWEDVQPCVALGAALREAEHNVCFFAPTTLVKLCSDHRFTTAEYKFDIEPLIVEALQDMDRKTFGTGKTMISKVMAMMQIPEVQEACKQFLPDLWATAQDFKPDVLIAGRAFPVLGICRKLGIPFINVTFQALAPTAEFPPVLINSGLPLKWFPSWHKWLGQTVVPFMLKQALVTYDCDNFERNVLEMPLHTRTRHLFVKVPEWAPTLVAVAPELLKTPKDYAPHLHFTGCWFLDENTNDFQPDPKLVDFLEDSSRPPVISVGFGSMKGSDGMSNDISRIMLRALRAASVRGVLIGGLAELSRLRLGSQVGDEDLITWAESNVMEINTVPYSWLFPRVRAVCHHGGVGALTAGLRAGKPAVIVPFFADQPYWAAKVEQQGLGFKGPAVTKLSVEVLGPLLVEVSLNRAMQKKASTVGESIRARDSLKDALAYIESFVNTYPYPWEVACQTQSESAEKKRRSAWPLDSSQDRSCCCFPRTVIPGFEPIRYRERERCTSSLRHEKKLRLQSKS